MALIRRKWRHLYLLIKKNRPSGVVSAWMTFFIVSYIIITKLDASGNGRSSVGSAPVYENVRKRTHKLPRRYGVERTNVNIIPEHILAEFSHDHSEAERNERKSYGGTMGTNGDIDEPVISLSASDNELMLFHEMEGREEEIDEHWKNYLDKDKNVVQTNQKSNQIMNPRSVKKQSRASSETRNILPTLPSNVKVFDALSEGKEFRDSIAENKCILLKTMHGNSPICIHDPDDDEIISSYLFENGAWEPNFLYIVGSILKLEPELLFLDLGCNVGVYTILAAKLGKTVVAVDPSKQNLRLLTKSLSLGNIRDRTTLLLNAISDKHENVSLVEIVGNIGGTFVEPADGTTDSKELETVTITLDDLSELFKEKPVFIKMDIETFEWKALDGGRRFFEDVDVRFILMEWIAHRGSDTGKQIIKFLIKRDLYPHVNSHHNTKLETDNFHTWPDNVLWIKY